MHKLAQQKWFFILTILVVYSSVGHAYDESLASSIQSCSKTTNIVDRLECFDKIADQVNAVAEQNRPALVNAVEPTSLASNIVTPPSSPAATSITNDFTPAPEVVSPPVQSTTTIVSATPPIITSAEPTTEEKIESFGLPKPSESAAFLVNGELNSTILEVLKVNGRNTRFVLANGQIWEKVDRIKVGLPRVGDNIVLREEALGAFYLRKQKVKRSFKVKRIKS